MKYNKSQIMSVAHKKCKIGQCSTLSEALKHTWFEEKFEMWHEENHATDKEEKSMCNEEAFYNNEYLRKQAQKYLDSGACENMEEAIETAWCDAMYEEWCLEQAMKKEMYYD